MTHIDRFGERTNRRVSAHVGDVYASIHLYARKGLHFLKHATVVTPSAAPLTFSRARFKSRSQIGLSDLRRVATRSATRVAASSGRANRAKDDENSETGSLSLDIYLHLSNIRLEGEAVK